MVNEFNAGDYLRIVFQSKYLNHKITLGKLLLNDTSMSEPAGQFCASCHRAELTQGPTPPFLAIAMHHPFTVLNKTLTDGYQLPAQ